jgi:hypothetical protein
MEEEGAGSSIAHGVGRWDGGNEMCGNAMIRTNTEGSVPATCLGLL